jgi:predicted RNase H-like nuclease (RuvC/YqgF family)
MLTDKDIENQKLKEENRKLTTKLKLKDEEIKDLIKKLQEEQSRLDKSTKASKNIDTTPLFGGDLRMAQNKNKE